MSEFYFINIVKLHVFYVPPEICSLASFSSTFLLVSTKEHQRENIPPKFCDENVFDSFFFFFFIRNKIFSNLYDIFLSFDIVSLRRSFPSNVLPFHVRTYICFKLNQAVRSWITLGEISILRFVVKLEIQKNIVFFLFFNENIRIYICVYVYARVHFPRNYFKLLQRSAGKWIN